MTVRLPSLCDFCSWKDGSKTCRACPDGIPEEILANQVDHRQPYPNDNGITFVQKPSIDPEYEKAQLALIDQQLAQNQSAPA